MAYSEINSPYFDTGIVTVRVPPSGSTREEVTKSITLCVKLLNIYSSTQGQDSEHYLQTKERLSELRERMKEIELRELIEGT